MTVTLELLQHGLVTIVTIGAAAVIVRCVTGVVRAPGAQPKCGSRPAAPQKPPETSPLTLIRKS